MDGDAVLRKKAKEVTDFNERLKSLVQDMKDTLVHSETGIGLAAPQVGMLKRIFVIDLYDGNGCTVYINPEIISKEGEQTYTEGCLSVPGKFGDVVRPKSLIVKAQDENGNWFEKEASDLLAVCISHEYDHLDGILFTDHVKGKIING